MPSSPATTQQDSLDVFAPAGGGTKPSLSKVFSMCRGGGKDYSESEDSGFEGGMNWCIPPPSSSKTTTKAKTLSTHHDDEEATTATGTTSTDRSGGSSSVGFWDRGIPSSIFSAKTSAVSFSPPPTPSRVDRSDCGGEEEDGSSSETGSVDVDAADATATTAAAAAEKTPSSSSSSIDVGFAIQLAACVAAVVMFPPSV
mmetsp:Transcript_55650/g.134893  ORF Transcript_55650/g.134893 Transcript_55650/m.134893 type:complete len:199 (-) Transcript_55650:445-1041(-)|eukprot:CAMPEP_0113460360 /NCGR_PEP_ID=MMETSP0014_2-20120614/10944_1 /TAXON_ID=2857 /ORGANISM="Nitzschia sp." /LENGTH=198 /DNA_ID=CAMNT_0000352005 /DNA_START=187 /DNA_END=783 /DNA_ORIENTATION=- /assembly_acc=CAM_ASM_000159